MRLICPNCSAQYEIDVTLIPDEGRDVQCSNCGHTWFELPPPAEANEVASAPDDAPEPETYDDPAPEPDEEGTSEPEPQSAASKAIAAATDDVATGSDRETKASEPFKDVDDPFEAAASEFSPTSEADQPDDVTNDAREEEAEAEKTEPENEFEDDEPQDVDLSAIAPTTLKARRPADAADVDVLREEAAREMTQRRARPSEALESQTDLGLESLTNRKTPSRALRARMARSSGNDTTYEDVEAPSEADYQAPQRDLLPDIDEINSTLNQNETNDPTQVAAGRSGFRLGFGLIVLLCVFAIFAYIFAPNIANAVPGTENALLRFVDLANQLRDWIDGLLA